MGAKDEQVETSLGTDELDCWLMTGLLRTGKEGGLVTARATDDKTGLREGARSDGSVEGKSIDLVYDEEFNDSNNLPSFICKKLEFC